MQATKEIRLRELHWKVMNNIFPTNILLHKMKIKENNLCDLCGREDFIDHVFVHCEKIQSIWVEIEKQLLLILNKPFKFTICDKLFGIRRSERDITTKERNIINHAILIRKLTISKFRYGLRYNIVDMLNREANLRQLW